MKIVIDVVAARTLARTLDVVIARNRLDVGEQPGLPERGDDGERFVERARRRVVDEIAGDQQDAVGNVSDIRHRLTYCDAERLDRCQQPARPVQMQVGDVRNDERSIHFAPLIRECCAAQTMRKMPSTNRIRNEQDQGRTDQAGIKPGNVTRADIACRCPRSMRAEPHGTI